MAIPEYILKLIKVYKQAHQNLVKIIAEKELKGNYIQYHKSLLNQVNQELSELNKYSVNWVNESIPKEYYTSLAEVNRYLKSHNIDISTADSFAGLHKNVVNLIVQNTIDDMITANNYIGRHIDDVLRQVGLEAVSEKISTGMTLKEVKKIIVNRLIDEGFTSVKDKRGRNISLSAYAQVVARSTTAEATNRALVNQLQNYGYDTVMVTSHDSSCPICAAYEGRVYSLTGKDKRFPLLSVAYSGEYLNIHPNCRHRLTPYIPELANDLERDIHYSNRSFDIDKVSNKKIDAYNAGQKKKAVLRNDRKQYERYRFALPDDCPKTFSGFRRMKLSDSDNWQQLQSDYRSLRQFESEE